jgi:accessory gene regulator protein AgrB
VSAVIPFSPEDMARRRKRAIAMALVLVALAAIFFITTMVRLGSNVGLRSL